MSRLALQRRGRARPGTRHSASRPTLPGAVTQMRTMFAVYVVLIAAGLVLYITVGLAHL
jgi:hypothetical protein